MNIAEETLRKYRIRLIEQEKSTHTIEKYMRDIQSFIAFLADVEPPLSKMQVIAYKESLKTRYATSSVNSMLTPVNDFLRFLGREQCRVRLVKCQRQIFKEANRELTKEEYMRLLSAAQKNHDERLYLLIKTICATGIRISELPYVTVEAAAQGHTMIYCKNKQRCILLPQKICRELTDYAKAHDITAGYIFRTKSGRPVDRSNAWHAMKRLGREAGFRKTRYFRITCAICLPEPSTIQKKISFVWRTFWDTAALILLAFIQLPAAPSACGRSTNWAYNRRHRSER